MQKKTFTLVLNIYTALVIIGFSIYAYSVQENWTIDISKEKYNLLIFVLLLFIGLVMSGIDAAGLRGKSQKIGSKTVYAGLSLAILFLVWRVLTAVF